jgi:hypothetical protein
MRTAKEVFEMLKRDEDITWSLRWAEGDGYVDYEEIIHRLLPEVIWDIEEREGDYQGDLYMIGHDADSKWYFFQQSFGSCSGCDELADTKYDEFEGLVEGMKKAVSVYDTKDALLEWAKKFDWTYEWRAKEEDSFESKLIKRIEQL